MKSLVFVMLFLAIAGYINAQTIPILPAKNDTAKSTKTSSQKPKTSAVEKPATATIKFLSDADGVLFIDGENKGSLKKYTPLRVNLAKGEYSIRVAGDNENDFVKWNYTVTETGTEKLQEVALQVIINRRLQNEALAVQGRKEAAIEAQKQREKAAEAQRRKEALVESLPKIEMITVGSFAIGKYEVTQAQWQAVMGNNPSYSKGDSLPIENVSWNDVQEFIQNLSSLTGDNYRLPTEKEWRFAAKGGNQSLGYKYSGSNDINLVAWYDKNSGAKTHPVGQKQPNELGIYDMTGNVCEWCSDWVDNWERVICGGCWNFPPYGNLVLFQSHRSLNDRISILGFRLALSL